MTENCRQSEICTVINDKWQGSIAKHLSCDGLLHYNYITQFVCVCLSICWTQPHGVDRPTDILRAHSGLPPNTRRYRSRGIRDDVTSGEPDVVPCERTWPPRPVAQLSRAIGRPFGTKYDNIDQNKAKKGRSRGARGQTGSKNMAATRFFDSPSPISYLTSNTS